MRAIQIQKKSLQLYSCIPGFRGGGRKLWKKLKDTSVRHHWFVSNKQHVNWITLIHQTPGAKVLRMGKIVGRIVGRILGRILRRTLVRTSGRRGTGLIGDMRFWGQFEELRWLCGEKNVKQLHVNYCEQKFQIYQFSRVAQTPCGCQELGQCVAKETTKALWINYCNETMTMKALMKGMSDKSHW